jgi:mannose-6-phosphate isomerase-like protein (cupin superfamily)
MNAYRPLTVIDIDKITSDKNSGYNNFPLTIVNDHVIRVSVMTEPFYWHYHPNSDETFMAIEGGLIIELENETVALSPGQLFTIPANVKHYTRPLGKRSVNLTIELEHMETVRV